MTAPRTPSLAASLRSAPARGATAVGVPLLAGRLLGFLGGIVLARWLGASLFGAYGWLLAWAATLVTISVFGFDVLLVRDVAALGARDDAARMAGLRRVAMLTTLMIGVPLAALAVVVLPHLSRSSSAITTAACAIVAVYIVASGVTRIRQSTLRGLHRPVIAQVPEAVVHPALLLLLLLFVARAAAPSLELALVVTALAGLGALLCVTWFLHRAEPPRAAARVQGDTRAWLGAATRMLLLTSLIGLHGRLDILALGALAGVASVGPYAAAISGAMLIPTALNLAVTATAPTLSALSASGQQEELREAVMHMTRLSLLGGVPVALAMIAFGDRFLALYGSGFGTARVALAILSAGQIVNVATGPVSTILTMAGRERDALLGMAIATGVHALLCVLLIPRWGMTGAAVATALAVGTWNIILWLLVRRHLGIVLSPFSITISGGSGA